MMNEGPRLSPQAIASAKDLECEKCQSGVFVPVFVIKHISALMSPTGQEINAPIQTFACAKCSHVNPEFVPKFD
jgi:hypothetical protein